MPTFASFIEDARLCESCDVGQIQFYALLKPFWNHWLSLQCIGSQQCDLFTNRTIFCAKSHLFLSELEWDSKTKQPIRF